MPDRPEESRSEDQEADGAYKLPEEAKGLLTRLIVSRRRQQLREKYDRRDSSDEEDDWE